MSEWLSIRGLRFRYRVDGTGQPVLLLHGVGSHLDAWDGVVAALKHRWQFIRFDQRGHGESDKPAGPYSLDDFSGDAMGVADALGLARFHLVGFSLGGLIAQAVALRCPERLLSLTLVSTVSGRTEDERSRVMARLALVEQGIPGAHFRESIKRWFTDAYLQANPGLIEEYAARNAQNDPKAYAAAYRVLAESDLADELPKIKLPTLVMTGEEDLGSNPRMARLIHERIAGSQLQILPKLRHSILIEAPDLVAAHLQAFLSKHGPTS